MESCTMKQEKGAEQTLTPQIVQKAHQNFQVWQVGQTRDSKPANIGGPRDQ